MLRIVPIDLYESQTNKTKGASVYIWQHETHDLIQKPATL